MLPRAPLCCAIWKKESVEDCLKALKSDYICEKRAMLLMFYRVTSRGGDGWDLSGKSDVKDPPFTAERTYSFLRNRIWSTALVSPHVPSDLHLVSVNA